MAGRNPHNIAREPAGVAYVWRASLPDSASCMAWSSGPEPTLGVGTFAGPVFFFSPEGQVVREEPGHAGGTLTIAFSPSGAWVATGGQDGRIHLHSLRDAKAPPICVHAGDAPVLHLSFCSSGGVLASASGRTVGFWSESGEKIGEVREHASTVMSLRYSEPRAGWFSACYGGVFELGRDSLAIERQLSVKTSILCAEISPCGRWVAAGTQDPLVRVWDLERDWDVIHLEGYPGKTPAVRFSEETHVLATASAAQVVLWSFGFGDPRSAPHVALSGHEGRVCSMDFTRQGESLLTASLDGYVRRFDLTAPGAQASAALNCGSPLHLLSLEPSRGLGAAAGTDGSLYGFQAG